MPGITVHKHINASQEKAFEYATDFKNAADRIRGITRLDLLTDGPVGVGTRFRETRTMFKREATEEMVVSGFDPPHAYTLSCDNHGCHYETEFRFTPNGRGTDIEMRFEAKPLTTVAKVLSFLMKPMMKSCANECAKDLDDLAAAIESDGRAGPAG